MHKSVYIRTFGCQMNFHDSEKILGILKEEGYIKTDNPKTADLIIFNTCSIRQKAEQKFYSELGRLKSYKKRKPSLQIAVAGCISQQDGKNIFKKASHVDFILGPQNIHLLKDLIEDKFSKIAIDDNSKIAIIDLPKERESRTKAWITIMYGCNNFCSYCIVPYIRGRERSRPYENIVSEATELAEKGYKEITLLGQNVNSYKSEVSFPELLTKLNAIDGIDRIRFVTSHPKDFSDELINSISQLPKVCEHIHLPMQSGSSKILKHMNRGYAYSDYLEKIIKLRKQIPGISITSDIITGFPGETEKDHLQTINALKEIEFDGIYAFKFSRRPLTKAAQMEEQVPEEIKSERLTEILRVQDEITLKINRSLEGTFQEILIEGHSKTDDNKITGRTRTNKIVNIQKITLEEGKLLTVKITKGKKHSLDGEPFFI